MASPIPTTAATTPIPSFSLSSPPPSLRAALRRDGFVIIRNILPAEQLSVLRAAAERTTKLARSGGWPHVRTVGKQFPPWQFEPERGIWGVQGLLNPALGPDSLVFARSYFSDEILGVAKVLMSSDDDDDKEDSTVSAAAAAGEKSESDGVSGACTDDDLVMELYNLLVRPETDFSLRWHRDDIPATATPEEELHRLGQPEWHTQWNLSLCDQHVDNSLVVVPGSHARARTEAERLAGPYEPSLPGQAVVELGAGDVVFYNNNILHRGVYDCSRERMSLHGSVGHVRGGKLRARNVLQHGVGAWVDKCDFREVFAVSDKSGCGGGDDDDDGEERRSTGRQLLAEKQRGRAEKMRAKLVKLGRESGDVGYSLTG